MLLKSIGVFDVRLISQRRRPDGEEKKSRKSEEEEEEEEGKKSKMGTIERRALERFDIGSSSGLYLLQREKGWGYRLTTTHQ
jgi:hypothetical protein